MTEINKTILEQANLAVIKGDNESFLEFCTDDIRWIFVGDTILDGKEAVRKYMNETYIEPPTFDVKKLIAENDFVTAIGEISLQDKSGEMIHYLYCDIWQFRDGRMCELTAFVIRK